jgi:hypothetical protein
VGASCLAHAVCDPFDDFAAKAHDVLQDWLESFRDTFEAEKPPTLSEISELFTQSRGQLLGGCMKAAIEELYAPYFEELGIHCWFCGRHLSRKRLDRKKCSTLQGEFELERPYFYCRDCEWSIHPLDGALGLARQRHQYDVQEHLTLLAADLPYETSADHFQRLTGIEVGNHFAFKTLNAITNYVRLEDVVPSRAEIVQRIDVAAQAASDPVLVVAIDGAHTPIRRPGGRKDQRGKGEWKETKGVRIYLTSDEERIVHIASWHRNGDRKAFAWDLKRIAARFSEVEIPIAVAADGARWIWKLAKTHFPGATQVLDYYHCSEHVYSLANEQYPDNETAAQWAEATLARLSLGRVGSVMAGLKRMKHRHAAAGEAIRKLIGYLGHNRRRVDYAEYEANGLPRGSGGIESANKYIHHARLKRSGAWWLKPNANRMLAVRCAVYNGTFRRVFDAHVDFQAELAVI